jgi:hypothetical protein
MVEAARAYESRGLTRIVFAVHGTDATRAFEAALRA